MSRNRIQKMKYVKRKSMNYHERKSVTPARDIHFMIYSSFMDQFQSYSIFE